MEVKGFEVEGVIKVDNVRIYGIEESIIASGYPMQTETFNMNEINLKDKDLKRAMHLGNAVAGSGHDCFAKGITVQFDLQVPEYIWRQLDRYHFIDYVSSQSKMHRILKMDLNETCNKYVKTETIQQLNSLIDAYNNFDYFLELIRTEKDVEEGKCVKYSTGGSNPCECDGWVEEEIIRFKVLDDKILYNTFRGDFEPIELTKENLFNMIIANTPSGIMLTARMTTNYLQLKSIVNQRSNHKMQEWRLLCDYFKTLPMFDLVCK